MKICANSWQKLKMNIQGKIIRNTDRGFDKAVMETLFNKRQLDRKPLMIVQPQTVEDIIEMTGLTESHIASLSFLQ